MALVIKNPPTNTGDIRGTGSIPDSGRSPGGGHGNHLQYSSLENPMDRGAWWATVHRVAKSWTQLKQLSTYARGKREGDKVRDRVSLGITSKFEWSFILRLGCDVFLQNFEGRRQVKLELSLAGVRLIDAKGGGIVEAGKEGTLGGCCNDVCVLLRIG